MGTAGAVRSGSEVHRSGVLTLVGVAASSAGTLAFEVALTRVFAVTQFYHFAFLSVSLALLGFGASGSLLTAFPALGRGGSRRWALLAAGQGIAIPVAYLVTNGIPFDSFAIAWDRRQILYLTIYYLVLVVPFLLAGLVVAVLLTGSGGEDRVPSHRVYAASLAGSGLGVVAALAGLDALGGEGTVLLSAALAMGGAAAFAAVEGSRFRWAPAALAAGALLLLAVRVPAPLAMEISPYKDLSAALRYPDATITETVWERGTRIDLVSSSGIRSLPGLSLAYVGPPPTQDGVTFDGDDLSPVPRLEASRSAFIDHLLGSLAFRLRPGGRALVLAPRGGLDVLVALGAGASSVVAVEPYGSAVDTARATGYTPFDHPRVEVVVAEPRVHVERTDERFDVVDLALTSPYRPVASGAYSLAEEYDLTVDAFETYLRRLAPGGVFTAMRWVQAPPSEETRLLATAVEAARRVGVDPADTVAMLRSYANAVVLVAPDGFSRADRERIRAFALAERFDVVTAPGSDPAAANRFNVVPDDGYARLAADLVTAPDPGAVYASYGFDITPPTDDRPFFGHYFTWAQASEVRAALGRTWQPFGGAGYFVLVALLAMSIVASLLLIGAPLLTRRGTTEGTSHPMLWWTLGYFGLIGTAFLFVEIPLIQQYILVVGHPATAFGVVVFAILAASGVGSALSTTVPWRPGAAALVGVAAVHPFVVRTLTPIVLPAPLPVRVVAVASMVAPLGFLMGIMFPRGVAHLERRASGLIPWAWAVNGTASVVSAVAAAMIALSYGFSVVVALGAAAYAGAALLARPGPGSDRPDRVNGTNETGPRLSARSSPSSSFVNRHSV